MRAGPQASLKAAGPDLTLTAMAPTAVAGRTAATTPDLVALRVTMKQDSARPVAKLPSAGVTSFELQGPGGAAAPVRGNGLVALAWNSTSRTLRQRTNP